MATTRKDAMPAGPGAEPSGDEEMTPPVGGDGADLVEIAAERLSDIVDASEAAGGVLTPELRSAVGSVIALLEAACPDYDDDMDDEDEEIAPMGPGEPTPMSARAKARKDARLNKVVLGRFRKMKVSPEAFVVKVAGLMAKATTTKNENLRKMRFAAIQKMLTYGPEQWGTSGFSSPGSDVPAIPMYEEAMVERHVADEAVPGEEAVRSAFAYDPTYTPNENSQTAYDVGSPDFMAKLGKNLAAVRKDLGLGKAGPAGDAAGVEGAPEGGPQAAPGETEKAGDEQPTESEAPLDKGRLNTEKDGGWSAAYVNELPDDAFLYVEGGGSKDEAGRTTPRELRHFPYKDQAGNVDLPHVRDALSRIPQSGVPDEEKAKLTSQALGILDDNEQAQKSALEKGARGDDGWPDDLADPKFLKGEKFTKHLAFGYDSLASKETTLRKAAENNGG